LGKIMESGHADLLRESVALVVREVMEFGGGRSCWRGAVSACGGAADVSQWVSAQGVGYAGGDDRAGDPEAAAGLLPAELPLCPQALRAGIARCRGGGVHQRRVDQEGRAASRAAGGGV